MEYVVNQLYTRIEGVCVTLNGNVFCTYPCCLQIKRYHLQGHVFSPLSERFKYVDVTVKRNVFATSPFFVNQIKRH